MLPYIITVHLLLGWICAYAMYDIDSTMDFIMYTKKPKKMHCNSNALLFVCVFITLQYSIHTVSA